VKDLLFAGQRTFTLGTLLNAVQQSERADRSN